MLVTRIKACRLLDARNCCTCIVESYANDLKSDAGYVQQGRCMKDTGNTHEKLDRGILHRIGERDKKRACSTDARKYADDSR